MTNLYGAVKQVLLQVPRCPDAGQMACASCLADAIAAALHNPHRSPLAQVMDDIPVFSITDAEDIAQAAIAIDRKLGQLKRTVS